MIDWNTYRMTEWDENEDFDYTKKEILSILKEQKVSLSKVRCLFNRILLEIEDNNPITFLCEETSNNISLNAAESKNIAKPSEYH